MKELFHADVCDTINRKNDIGGTGMFEQTKELCQHFLDMGIPCFDLVVYKDGECVLRHMGGYADPEKRFL